MPNTTCDYKTKTKGQKPEWERKVFDEKIVGKWHDESCKYIDDLFDDYLSLEMFDHVSSVAVLGRLCS